MTSNNGNTSARGGTGTGSFVSAIPRSSRRVSRTWVLIFTRGACGFAFGTFCFVGVAVVSGAESKRSGTSSPREGFSISSGVSTELFESGKYTQELPPEPPEEDGVDGESVELTDTVSAQFTTRESTPEVTVTEALLDQAVGYVTATESVVPLSSTPDQRYVYTVLPPAGDTVQVALCQS
jgi:hypothetical protein